MRLIDADALLDDLKSSAKDAREWKEETQDEEIKIRAEQAFGTFVECALRVKNAPTIKPEVRHGRWIPCSEKLPEKHVEVLAYSPYWGKIVVAMWGGEFWLEQWTDDDLEQSEITHWMPLPEPPESEVQDDETE